MNFGHVLWVAVISGVFNIKLLKIWFFMWFSNKFWACQTAIVGFSGSMYEKLLKQYYILSCDSTISLWACSVITSQTEQYYMFIRIMYNSIEKKYFLNIWSLNELEIKAIIINYGLSSSSSVKFRHSTNITPCSSQQSCVKFNLIDVAQSLRNCNLLCYVLRHMKCIFHGLNIHLRTYFWSKMLWKYQQAPLLNMWNQLSLLMILTYLFVKIISMLFRTM